MLALLAEPSTGTPRRLADFVANNERKDEVSIDYGFVTCSDTLCSRSSVYFCSQAW